MDLLQAMVFGIIQGLTEFLPVSSSAHLDLYSHLVGLHYSDEQKVAFFAVLHLGSLGAVIALFWRDLLKLVPAIPSATRKLLTGRWRLFRLYEKLLFLLALGTLPAGIIGVLAEDAIEAAFGSITMVGFCLVLTGCLLWLTRLLPTGYTGIAGMRPRQAVAIGCAQALAILPGISRSGSTIVAGLALGLDREIAARFSFLLSLPVVAGAGLLKLGSILNAAESTALLLPALVGALFAFVSSFLALRWLLQWVKQGALWWFAPYLWATGLLVLVVQEYRLAL